MAQPILSKDEWYAMMAMVLDVNIDPTDRWSEVQAPGNQDGPHLDEIPDAHPAEGGPKTPEADVDDEIPAGGGFATKPAATPKTGPVMKEIPSDGPADDNSPADKPNKLPDGKWGTKIGKPESTGKPSGSFAKLTDLQYDGVAWSTKPSYTLAPSKTVTQWSGMPAGTADGSGPDAPGQYKNVSQDDPAKFPGRSKGDSVPKPSNADEDLDHDIPDNLSLPDGSFMTLNVDDLKNNINKVQNAEQVNGRPDHPWYMDVKRHLANRAADLQATHLIPKDWQLSMAMLAEAEMARDIDAATRKEYAKKGWALPDGSYPIGNASDLQNALTLARSGHGNASAAMSLIRRRAKDLGVKLPSDMK